MKIINRNSFIIRAVTFPVRIFDPRQWDMTSFDFWASRVGIVVATVGISIGGYQGTEYVLYRADTTHEQRLENRAEERLVNCNDPNMRWTISQVEAYCNVEIGNDS